jgi:polyhydroxyalkanoate synthase
MNSNVAPGSEQGSTGNPQGQRAAVDAHDVTGNFAALSAAQLKTTIARDPLLRALDGTWNANPLHNIVPVDWAQIIEALRTVWLQSLTSPEALTAATRLNEELWISGFSAWTDAAKSWWGIPVAEAKTGGQDKRFAAPEWTANPFYSSLKQAYLLASDWLLKYANSVAADDTERKRLAFHLRQFVDAMSPTLMLTTNPEAMRRVMETGGASLVDGAENLLTDLREGRLSMVDANAFAPGRNLALTPGKVVYRNRLMELIQYAPTTDTTYEQPLLVIPPWINKYYIMDMQPKNSMMGYLVAQGFTVFVISWKNPDASMSDITIEDYMNLGPLAASDVARRITGSAKVNALGYCIGGTLLAMTLAWLAGKADDRFEAATFMVSLQDFSKVGDTEFFLGDDKIDFIEQQMLERGYLDSREMSNMFNLLRPNDLIWSNVVNNYLLGKKPPAFDLLYWNSDGTRMAPRAHSWYLRNTYVENNLIKPGKVELEGEALDLGRIALDIYAVGAEKDHIVPWDAAWQITRLVSGDVRFVLASSGHIAGMINPPIGSKRTYWVAPPGTRSATAKEWRSVAAQHEGSWWTDWTSWLAERSGAKVTPPALGTNEYPALEDAPGRNVLER